MSKKTLYQLTINALCKDAGIELPVSEYQFAPPRKFRFDFAWVKQRIAIEVNGGLWIRGRHTRGTGQLSDMEKFNIAMIKGWSILQYTPQQIGKQLIDDVLALMAFNKIGNSD